MASTREWRDEISERAFFGLAAGSLAHLWGFEAAKGCGHYGMELLMMHGMLLHIYMRYIYVLLCAG
jgi:hypothetical protein